jgi:rRNA-processing protein FCF1
VGRGLDRERPQLPRKQGHPVKDPNAHNLHEILAVLELDDAQRECVSRVENDMVATLDVELREVLVRVVNDQLVAVVEQGFLHSQPRST